ncbi:MAG: sigma-70 family RNA polymerase sigma factor [Planctomycetes bacterium]|nr:sigma-70 family RNA polymerase sigma factor [Planctomycetota bacterium]
MAFTMAQEPREFPETHWSQLLELQNPSHPRHAEHLGVLVQQYWKPAYLYLRAIRAMSAEDAEDLTQQFFAMLLARRSLDKLSPNRGSFRGFLKTALRRFVVSAQRQEASRGGRLFRFEEAEALHNTDLSPESAFDREWARGVVAEMMRRLREEFRAQGKEVYYEIFQEYVGETAGAEVSYDDLAKLHRLSADDVRNYLRVIRQRGREILKDLLRDYLFPGEDVEDELRFILSR